MVIDPDQLRTLAARLDDDGRDAAMVARFLRTVADELQATRAENARLRRTAAIAGVCAELGA